MPAKLLEDLQAAQRKIEQHGVPCVYDQFGLRAGRAVLSHVFYKLLAAHAAGFPIVKKIVLFELGVLFIKVGNTEGFKSFFGSVIINVEDNAAQVEDDVADVGDGRIGCRIFHGHKYSGNALLTVGKMKTSALSLRLFGRAAYVADCGPIAQLVRASDS